MELDQKLKKYCKTWSIYRWGYTPCFPRDYKRMPEPEHISVAEPEKVYAFMYGCVLLR